MEIERRFLGQESSRVELREDDGKTPKIVGLAAVTYNGTAKTQYKLWDKTFERIMPGTFDRAVAEDDVRGLFNHDPNQLLGRATAGTLSLAVTKRGLAYEITPGDTTVGRDVLEHVRRGDLQGSSFSFTVTDEAWRKEKGISIREITGVNLFDVGPVTFPAYEATTTAIRAESDLGEARASFDRWEAELGREATAGLLRGYRARSAQVLQEN